MSGSMGLEDLCRAVKRMGMKSVALTDTNGLYGLVFFLQIAKETGLRPIIGAEVVTDTERAVLLVKTEQGYAHLCRILTHRHQQVDFILSDDLCRLGEDLVILSDNIDLLGKLKGHADLYAEFMPGRSHRPVLRFARAHGIRPVATAGACFQRPEDYKLHRLLRAIDLNTKLSRLPESACAPESAWLMPPETIASYFPHVPEALSNTATIARCCRFTGTLGRIVSTGFEGLEQSGIMEKLRAKVDTGAKWRYGVVTPPVRRRIDYEMEIIETKGFGAIFLVVQDIVKESPRTCGRGSAAASIVSYCLGITHVDPIKYNLYFERFLNPGRTDPPDIDVDFPWDERDGILDYVFDKYGPKRSAMVANHVGFRPRAAVREIAKVYGLPEVEIKTVTDRLAHLWHWTGESVEEVIQSHPVFKGLKLDAPWPEIIALSRRLDGKFRHLSVHCGGVVVVPDDLSQYVPTQTAPKGVNIIHWEKDQCEDSGLVKIDLLGNRSLAVIRDALAAITRNTGRVIDYAQFNPLDDEKTQALIARGDTLGVFYVESPATRQLQKKAGVGDYEHLVIHSSIIRPAANPYINEYVRRLHGAPYKAIHPILERVLGETYGIMTYQEDVTKIAVEMAGFSPQDGDGLRKTLSKKRNHQRLEAYRAQFEAGAKKRGIGPDVVDPVWEMILSFGGYSFCKPHSASYAMVSFKSAYLRAHYPAEFMAAVISNQGGYYTPFAYLSECRRMGLELLPVDVNRSEKAYKGRGRKIRMGLMQLKGVKARAIDALLAARAQGGDFLSFEGFLRRTRMHPSDCRILIKAGCLDAIAAGRSRAQLLWETAAASQHRPPAAQADLGLFDQEVVAVPQLEHYDFRTLLLFEVETLGFPLSVHPLDLYDDAIRETPHIRAVEMHRYIGKRVSMIGWWVTNKMVYTRQEEPMAFISFEDRSAMYETVFFPPAFRKYASRFTPVRPYVLSGKVDDELGALSLHVEGMRFLGRNEIRRRKMNRPGEQTRLPSQKNRAGGMARTV